MAAMSKHLVGACSLCGGPVTVPAAWMSVLPPVPHCERCGATPKNGLGPIIDMEPRKLHPHDKLRGWGAALALSRTGDAR
jgi:hypothetical protein